MIIATVVVVSMASCSQETVRIEDNSTNEAKTLSAGMVEVGLNEVGLDARLMVPGKQRTGVDPTVSLNDVTNHINIRSGKNYNVMLREEDMDLATIKADLDTDIMFRNEIVVEQPECILYKRILPDDSDTFHHFAAVIDLGGSTIVIRSHEMGTFSQKQAERMMESCLTLSRSGRLALK